MRNIINIIKKHIRLNIPIYFITLLFFTIGIVVGTYTIKALSYSQKVELMDYLEGFFQLFRTQEFNSIQLFLNSFFNNIKIFILFWILGLTLFGFPLILLLLGFKGFVLGFTLGFVIEELALKGVLFIVLSILPHNLFHIPGLLGIGIISMSFSIFIFKNKVKREKIYNKKGQVITYTITMLLISILLLMASLVEAYITPILMKLLFTT
ncbi:MAG TPA: stage II sporulation protein M [Eubacteriaceae bacterium]|nr:stage II sporulation protein M [Eubacteriaceae bacterium]